MKRLAALASFAFVSGPTWAFDMTKDPSDPSNFTDVGLAKDLFCQTYSALTGQYGLLLGFAMAIYGLYILINTQKMYGLWVIVFGALLTALPGVLVSMAKGLWALTAALHESGSLPIPSC